MAKVRGHWARFWPLPSTTPTSHSSPLWGAPPTSSQSLTRGVWSQDPARHCLRSSRTVGMRAWPNQKPHPFDEVTCSVSPTGPPGKKFTVYFVPFPSPFSYSLVYSIKFQIVHFTYFFLVHIKKLANILGFKLVELCICWWVYLRPAFKIHENKKECLGMRLHFILYNTL